MLLRLAVAFCLMYPVLSFATHTHEDVCASLVGGDNDRQKILSYQDGFFSDELGLEDQVRKFLEVAPDLALQAIGASFHRDFSVSLLDSKDALEAKNSYGENWQLVLDRQAVLDISRFYVSAEDWAIVEPFFANQEVYDFISRALVPLRRPVRSQLQKLREETSKPRIQAFLQILKGEIPSYKYLLEHSSLLRDSFNVVAKHYLPKFKLDLSQQGAQTKAIRMLESRDFKVNPSKFMLDWFLIAMNRYNKAIKGSVFTSGPREDLDGALAEAVQFWEERDLFDVSLRPFIVGLFSYLKTGGEYHSGAAVRRQIQSAVNEHHQLLLKLAEHQDPISEEVFYDKYTPFQSPAYQAPSEKARDLSLYITGAMGSELEPDIPYYIQFKRDFGHRNKVREIIFTKRGFAMLKAREDDIAIRDWVKALALGFARSHGNNGIKFLQVSPVPGMPHFTVEVKLLKTGFRMLGYRDHLGRLVFDYLTDEYHH